MKRGLFLPLIWVSLIAAAPRLDFVPSEPGFAQATQDYRRLWAVEGTRIIAAMEEESGLTFHDASIQVIVYEGVSYSGMGNTPMRMRASYSEEVKKGSLIHELGHRLIASLPRTAEMDEHRVLFLFLYDVWVRLYGRDFADRMVHEERQRTGLYDYDAAWTWALALTREERRARLRALRESMQRMQLPPGGKI
jgi:hypothetical protein